MAKHGDNKNVSSIKEVIKGITTFKRDDIQVGNNTYQRIAIHTHFIERGEDYTALCQKYVTPIYQENDILSVSEKIVSLCQNNIVDMEDVKLGWWAKNLSKLATSNDAGVGMDEPYKLQLAINLAGLPRILFAVFCGGIGKLLGKRGWFYTVAGHEIAGIDGFYFRSSFEIYHRIAILNPKNPNKVCNDLYKDLKIVSAIVDANDYGQELLGASDLLDKDLYLKTMIDNPAGQDDELTPFVIIRKI